MALARAILPRVSFLLAVGALAGAVVFFLKQPVFPRRAASPVAVDPARLRLHVEKLAGLAPRNLTRPENLEAAAAYIRKEWESTGLTVVDQPYRVGKHDVRNLIVRFGGEAKDPLVVGAHYDACGPFPGADDNASGAAGLIELGRALATNPPKGPVELVAYTLEEPPHFFSPEMGSVVHAASLKKRGIAPRGMIGLEMIGDFSDAKGSQHFPIAPLALLFPTRGNFVAVVGRPQDVRLLRRVKAAMAGATDLPVQSLVGAPRLTDIDLSDHSSYWREGMTAVMVSDTAFYRNERYHTADDTPERLDYVRMAKVVSGLVEAVRDLARR
ncbi:MAG TPA: M28 family peptidase [Thermoanaerobaculia bacterium]|jgi:hypothetical protein|nr:M28 family peptidase [Thermoanaerobaculia bacterium]